MFGGKELPADYLKIFDKYWEQVKAHISDLESKLGQVNKIYHELISSTGKDGMKVLKKLNAKSHRITETSIEKGGQLEAVEDAELLTEFMDWGQCLSMGLQSQ